MVETFTGTPLLCAMCYVLLSLLVWCVIAHKNHQANFMNRPVMFWGLKLGGSRVRMELLKVAKFSQCSSSAGIWLKPLSNAAYVACLPLLCQGFKWLNKKSVWLVFRRSWAWIPAGSRIFSWIYFSLSQQKKQYCKICCNKSIPVKKRKCMYGWSP